MFVIRSSSKLGKGVNGQAQRLRFRKKRPANYSEWNFSSELNSEPRKREQLNQLTPLIDATTVYGVSEKHKNMLTDSDGMHLKMDNHRFGDFLPTVDDFRDPEIKKNFETADVFNDKGHDENVAGDTRVLENATLTR